MAENGTAGFDVDELCLSFLVRQAWMSMRTSVESVLEDQGLSLAQYACLLVLERQSGITIADLGRAMSSTRQSMNELLRGLATRAGGAPAACHRSAQSDCVPHRHRAGAAEPGPPARQRARAGTREGIQRGERSAARDWLRGVVRAAS